MKKPRAHVDFLPQILLSDRKSVNSILSIRKLLKGLRKDNILDCRHNFLCKKLHKMGLNGKKYATNRKILIERPNVAVWRTYYLHEIRKHKREGKNIIYVDKTYVQQSHSVQSCCSLKKSQGSLLK